MKKTIFKKILQLIKRHPRKIILSLVVLLPYIAVYLSIQLNIEVIGRLIAYSIFYIFGFLLIIWILLPRNKKELEIPFFGLKTSLPFRLFFLALAVIFLPLLFRYTLDLVLSSRNPILIVGKVESATRNVHSLIVRHQSVTLEKNNEIKLKTLYAPHMIRRGEYIQVKYLPRTKLIVELKNVLPE